MSEQFSAKHYAKKAEKWATGTIAQCRDGSAKHWAQIAQETADSIGNPANRDLSNLTDVGLLKFDAKQDILTPGNNIEIDENGVISTNATSLPLFVSFKTGHILNDVSYVNGRLFSWLSGAVYTSAYQELIKEMTGSTTGQITSQTVLYAFLGPIVVYTKTLTLSENLPVYDKTGEEIGYLVVWDNPLGYEFRRTHGAPDVDIGFSRLNGQDIIEISGVVAEQKTQTIAGVTITYYLTATNKKICLPDQADNVAALYTATGAADFYLLDTENGQFKLPRPNVRRLLRSYKTNDDWYNLYSDGWCVQGGSCVAPNNELKTINLKQSYQDINYDILLTQGLANSARYQGRHPIVNSDLTTVNSFVLQNARFLAETTAASKIYWRTSGYADTSLIQDEFEYEYYFLGNTEQNQTSVDVGQMTQTLTGKADVDLNNADPSLVFKEKSIIWGLPDYSKVVSLTVTSYTATQPCFVSCDSWNTSVYINDTVRIGYGGATVNVQVFLDTGDKISGYSTPLLVFPLKGLV